ncbi:MAG: AAA family ATPase [Deltaproteobacteria bacterium]|nr:AAA family ATPase [Deltaproteobacteria bacterium]
MSGPPADALVVVVAGPNGAGKSTAAPRLLRDTLHVDEFVNADVIAAGLSAFRPEGAAVAAGRIMLARMNELAAARRSFAFETTLASRSFAPWLSRLATLGYRTHLLFLWLESADLAVSRVAERVRVGGHGVPEATIRRRYESGLENLFALYQPIVDSWLLFDNSRGPRPKPVASGGQARLVRVVDVNLWKRIEETYLGRA